MITPVELFSRVLGLLEQPDWPAARAFVAAHSLQLGQSSSSLFVCCPRRQLRSTSLSAGRRYATTT